MVLSITVLELDLFLVVLGLILLLFHHLLIFLNILRFFFPDLSGFALFLSDFSVDDGSIFLANHFNRCYSNRRLKLL